MPNRLDLTTAEAWERFVLNGEPLPLSLPGIRPEILASWRHSLQHKISPCQTSPPALEQKALDTVQQLNHALISVARPYLKSIYSYVRHTDYAIALADRQGCIIDLVGGQVHPENPLTKSGLRLGTMQSELSSGATGIGLCISRNAPCMVCGAEHFLRCYHPLRCCAAPIRDSGGEMIGCLALFGPADAPGNHYVLGMVGAATDAIHKELQMRKSCKKIGFIDSQLRIALESLPNGILVVDSDMTITQHNSRAAKILQLGTFSPLGMKLPDLLLCDSSMFDLRQIAGNISHQELRITNPNGAVIDLSLSAKLITAESGERRGIIFSIDQLHNIHKLVTRIGGFTARYTFDSIIGSSPELLAAKRLGQIAAESQSNLLILGESGTGKELFAQAVHNASPLAGGPFVAINCASLPKSLIESELFGYERGAFTGANRDGSPGKFELADSGTIFLDEIGDMPMELQASLLRVLQTREIVRIGGKQPKKINVRIIAATNVDLLRSVQENRFRQDLYYRLNVLTLYLRPLRECSRDILPLLRHFTERYNLALGKHCSFAPEALELLQRYDWPGNVRELENVIERTFNLAQGELITEQDLPPELTGRPNLRQAPRPHVSAPENPLDAELPLPKSSTREYDQIVHALLREHGDIPSVSRLLHMPTRTLYRKIKKYNIDLQQYRVW